MPSMKPQTVRYAFMAVHVSVLVIMFAFVGFKIGDTLSLLLCGVLTFFTLVYLVPVAIMCMCGRVSRYETGWVEILYQSLQTLFTTVLLMWVISIHSSHDENTCAAALGDQDSREAYLNRAPIASATIDATKDRCKQMPVSIALATIHLFVLVSWFAWTLWVTTKAARLMGERWTRSKALRRLPMTTVCKTLQPGQSDANEIEMSKNDAAK